MSPRTVKLLRMALTPGAEPGERLNALRALDHHMTHEEREALLSRAEFGGDDEDGDEDAAEAIASVAEGFAQVLRGLSNQKRKR